MLMLHFALPCLVLITGASGCGKTTFLQELAKVFEKNTVSINHFDDVGVPSVEVMIEKYGSCEKWQEAMTHAWIEKLSKILDKKLIVLEGSFNPAFALSKLQELKIKNYRLVCLHADRQVRDKRLIEIRKQPELATDDMENFAQFLRAKTLALGGCVIDSGVEFSGQKVKNILENLTLDVGESETVKEIV